MNSFEQLAIYCIFLGEEFVFRGESNDWVTLCSEKAVYDIKEAETSNSLLLVKDMLSSDSCNQESKENAHQVTVVKTFFTYLEMKPAKPGWQKLFELLESRTMKNCK